MPDDELYMQRCVELARLGLGKTTPNPMVGAVVVQGGRITGEGYHRRYGGHHAEVEAIESVRDKESLTESSLYVSLEPCCHHGKTPPCTDLILRSKIPRVIVGTADPFDEVAGKGIARLRANGCEVTVGVLKEECRKLNKRFFTFHEKKRPYIILKWAMTADAFIDIKREDGAEAVPTWITSEKLRMLVHKWRTEEAAIIVGTNTVVKDNPRLNVRNWNGPSPLRIFLDRKLAIPAGVNLLDNSLPTVVVNEITEKTTGRTTYWKIPFDGLLLHNLAARLYENNIQSLIVEGGQMLLQSFIDQGLWDEARVFAGRQFFGQGVRAPGFSAGNKGRQVIIGNECFYYFRNSSGAWSGKKTHTKL